MVTLLLSKRAAGGPRSVGDKISLRGFGKIRFEIVDVATHGEEMYYKVKPVDVVYGVPAGLVEEERHSEKKPVEGKAKPSLSRTAAGDLCQLFGQRGPSRDMSGWEALSKLQQFLFYLADKHVQEYRRLQQGQIIPLSAPKLQAFSRTLAAACRTKDRQAASKAFDDLLHAVFPLRQLENMYGFNTSVTQALQVLDEIKEVSSNKGFVFGEERPPLSKRADETPIIPLERGRNKRVIKEIREENERKLKEMGLDSPPEYPEKHTFFGEQFLPGDFIVTKKEPGKVWRVVKREESKRLGVAYSVQSMEEALVWAQDVARGMKGGYVLELPKSEWDVPGKGLPPVRPKAVEEAPRRLSRQEMIEEENKRRLSELTPSERAEEERNRQKWFRMLPLANKLIARLEPLAKGQAFGHPHWELKNLKEQVASGYRARLVHQFENAIKEAYWVLKGIPAQEGWKRLQEKRDKERGK